MAPTRMSFEVQLGRAGGRRRESGAPLRLLVAADLGGRRTAPLVQRRPLAVDVDRFELVFAGLAPSIRLDVDGIAIDAGFGSLDDFHPDSLVERLPVFDALRRARAELADPARFRRAAAALGLTATPPATNPPAAADAQADIERLLGRPITAPAAPAPAPGAAAALDAWLRERIAPHVVPDVADEQRALLRAADEALGALMRRVLHDPRLQALESAWRGVDRLVRGLELGESVRLALLDVSFDELAADLAAHQGDLSASAMHRILAPASAPDGEGFDALVLDFAFGPDPSDLRTLASLGAVAGRAGSALLAGARPQLAGSASLADLADPRRWSGADAPDFALWNALRTSPIAPGIGLALPRVLLRLPYGAATDPVASFAFEEMPAAPGHESYLWGRGSLALALLAGRAFERDGQETSLASSLDLEDLPSHVVGAGDERRQQPCAELLLPEAAGLALQRRGLMPLMSWRDRNAVRLLGWQSIADPPGPIRGLQA